MQSKDELESWYKEVDPWGYQTNADDSERKRRILAALGNRRFNRALDIGAGEGFITKDLPANELYALEISERAKKRLPAHVKPIAHPEGFYDLITACGVMYAQYAYLDFLDIIRHHASGIVLLCNIKDWEVRDIAALGTPIHVEEFPYREYVQRLRIYETRP